MLHNNVDADHDRSKPRGFIDTFTCDISKAVTHSWSCNTIIYIQPVITDYT